MQYVNWTAVKAGLLSVRWGVFATRMNVTKFASGYRPLRVSKTDGFLSYACTCCRCVLYKYSARKPTLSLDRGMNGGHG